MSKKRLTANEILVCEIITEQFEEGDDELHPSDRIRRLADAFFKLADALSDMTPQEAKDAIIGAHGIFSDC